MAKLVSCFNFFLTNELYQCEDEKATCVTAGNGRIHKFVKLK